MYEIVVKRKVRRAIARLPESVFERVERAIDDLATDPRPRGAIKMRGLAAGRAALFARSSGFSAFEVAERVLPRNFWYTGSAT